MCSFYLVAPTSKAHSELIEDVQHKISQDFTRMFKHHTRSYLANSGLILSSSFLCASFTCFLKLFSLLVAGAVYVAAARPPGCGVGDTFSSIDGSSCDTPRHTSIKATKEGVVSEFLQRGVVVFKILLSLFFLLLLYSVRGLSA